jgi:hypothetical protein
MKKTNKIQKHLLVAGLGIALISASNSQAWTGDNTIIYQTDFSTSTSYNPVGGAPISSYTYGPSSPNNVFYDDVDTGNWINWVGGGQDGWYNSSQVEVGLPDFQGPGVINYITDPAYANYPNLMAFGGASLNSLVSSDPTTFPNSRTSYLIKDIGTAVNKIHFDSTFYLWQGSASRPQQDTFGWTLFNKSGNALLSINYVPTYAPGAYPSNNSLNQTYSLTATSFASNGTTNQTLLKISGNPLDKLSINNNAHFGFDVSGLGTANQTISVYNYTNTFGYGGNGGTGTLLGTTTLNGSDYSNIQGGTDIAALGLTWSLASSANRTYTNTDGSTYVAYTNYGNNSIAVANLTIAVPEPQTWVLFGLSGLIVVVALRRRVNS